MVSFTRDMYNILEGMRADVCVELSHPIAIEISSIPLTVDNSVSGYDDAESVWYKITV